MPFVLRLAAAIAFMTCILEAPDSNLSLCTGYLDWCVYMLFLGLVS
jgi:hypothetical protein